MTLYVNFFLESKYASFIWILLPSLWKLSKKYFILPAVTVENWAVIKDLTKKKKKSASYISYLICIIIILFIFKKNQHFSVSFGSGLNHAVQGRSENVYSNF